MIGVTKSAAPGAELCGGTSGIPNPQRGRKDGRKEGRNVALLPLCSCLRPLPPLETGAGWAEKKNNPLR